MSSSLNQTGRPKRSQPPKSPQTKGPGTAGGKASAAARGRGRRKATSLDKALWHKAGRLALAGAAVAGALGVGILLGGGFRGADQTVRAVPESAIAAHSEPLRQDQPLSVTARRSESLIAALPYEEGQTRAPDATDAGEAQLAQVLSAMQPPPPPLGDEVSPAVSNRPAQPAPPSERAETAALAPPKPAQPSATPSTPAISDPLDQMQQPADGQQPWLAYAAPMPDGPADQPLIAIVIDDMGIDQPRSRRALALPGPITFAFLPYGYHLKELSGQARAMGGEVLVHMPMEPSNASVDPGPHALTVGLSAQEIQERLRWGLSQLSGYVGFNNHMGSRFTAWTPGMETVLDEAKARGLLFLDSVTTGQSKAGVLASSRGLPFATRDVFLDDDQAPAAIARQLARLEEVARKRGHAIAIGHPHDATIAALAAWLPGIRDKGFRLGTVSAIIRLTRGGPSGQG